MSFRISISYDAYFSGFNSMTDTNPWDGKDYMRNAFEVSIAYKGIVAKRKGKGVRAPKLR